MLPDKGIVVKAYISVEKSHKAGDRGPVRHVVGCVARSGKIRHAVVRPNPYTDYTAADEIVHDGTALGGKFDGARREQEIVVDQGRSVRHFDKEIFTQPAEQ